MKEQIKFLIFSLIALTICIGNANAQRISDKFEQMLVSENFDVPNDQWTTMANAENLFIIQDGEYILQRRNATAPFVILAGLPGTYSDFRLVTSIKLEKTMGSDATAGLMFMMQPQGVGGFLIEINKKKEFRLRQITSSVYRYLTGNSKNSGWTKNNMINEAGLNNIIELRTSGGTYDLYLNDNYVMSFFEPAYTSGTMGLVIGPDSKARVDFMYIFAKGSSTIADDRSQLPDSTDASENGDDVIKLAESIITLKSQLNALKNENDDLKKVVASLRSGENESSGQLADMQAEISSLRKELEEKDQEIEKLRSENTQLSKYKEMTGGNDNGDLVITLSKALKSEKEKNQKLEAEIKELRSRLTTKPK